MKKSIAMKWVAELRSGKHRQARGSLKFADGSMCCLGVLCANVLKLPHKKDGEDLYYFDFESETNILPEEAMILSGIQTYHGKVCGEYLTNLNDIGLPAENLDPFTFDEIADLIQINWKDL
jgi:hypothetical protein